MGKKQVATQELREQMVELYRAGKTGPEIAVELGIGETTVYRWLPRSGIYLRPPVGRLKRGKGNYKLEYSGELALCERYREGATLKQLMEEYGFGSYESVRKILMRHGMKMRSPGAHTFQTLDPVLKRQIVAYHKKNKSVNWIANELHMGNALVKRYLLSVGRLSLAEPGSGANWKGGTMVTHSGYRLVKLAQDAPFFCMAQNVDGYVREHRLVMAQYLDRPLYSWETVHHIDGNRGNNDITNLQLRIGKHGSGVTYRCMACGSDKLEPVGLKET